MSLSSWKQMYLFDSIKPVILMACVRMKEKTGHPSEDSVEIIDGVIEDK